MGQAAERIRVRKFRAIAQELSVRANHVLENLGVHDVAALLSLTREDLVRAWSCGKKTIAEIEDLQARLREASETPATEEIRARLSFHESTNEVFDAVRGILSVRCAHALENLGVDSLEKLMSVTKEELLDCRNCGKKTAAEILRLQAELGDLARHVAQERGEFRSEILLFAPCLAAPAGWHEPRSIEEHMLADAENPAPWLLTWVRGLARTERQARAFMLRKGMLGLTPMTLDRVGEQVGNVTRERARQMDKVVEKRAAVPLQQQRLRPLIDAAVVVVKERGGLIALEELTEAVLCRGEDGDQLRFATELIAFFSTLQVWKDAGLRLQRDGAVRSRNTRLLVRRLAGLVQKVAAAAADERQGNDLWSIEREHLKQTLGETYAAEFGDPPLITVSDAMFDALLKQRRQSIRRRGDRVYSLPLWQLRFGNVVQMVDAVLKRMGRPAHFTKISEEAAKWRPGLSANNIHATLDRSKTALLWDLGTFVHQDNVVIPLSLIHDVERWLLRALREDVPFVSANGAFLHFRSRCEKAGFPSEVALYTCLRRSAHPELVYPRLPCVYRKQGFTERIPIVFAFEDFLRDAEGPVSQQELKDFGLRKLFLKDYQYSQLSQRVSNVMRTADWGYVHLDNYDLDHETLAALVRYTQEVLAMEGHCSVDKIYREKRVTCRSAGINGPVMLYSVFQCFAEDAFALNGYPYVVGWDRKKRKQRDTFRQRVINFVRDSGGPCLTLACRDVEHDAQLQERLKKLLIRRAQIVSAAENKIPLLLMALNKLMTNSGDRTGELRDVLIYCAPGTHKEVLGAVSSLGLRCHEFVHTVSMDKRETVLQQFAKGDIQALIAIHCLDEGVDIPSTRTAFFLASTTNPKEFIQRRGRILRRFQGKMRADVYDFVVVPDIQYAHLRRDTDIGLLRREMPRFSEFAASAENEFEARSVIREIVDAYQMLHLFDLKPWDIYHEVMESIEIMYRS